jgi:hypothetical protein
VVSFAASVAVAFWAPMPIAPRDRVPIMAAMADPAPDPQVRRMMRPREGPARRRDGDGSRRAHRWQRGREAGDGAGAAIELGRGTVRDPRVLAQLNGADLAPAVTHRLRADGEHGLLLARLPERIVERCVRIDAPVMPVEGAAADVLAEAGGVTALPRW